MKIWPGFVNFNEYFIVAAVLYGIRGRIFFCPKAQLVIKYQYFLIKFHALVMQYLQTVLSKTLTKSLVGKKLPEVAQF
jgi:hypothetical protein